MQTPCAVASTVVICTFIAPSAESKVHTVPACGQSSTPFHYSLTSPEGVTSLHFYEDLAPCATACNHPLLSYVEESYTLSHVTYRLWAQSYHLL